MPATYYEVLTDFMSKHPESHILDNRAAEIFWSKSEEGAYSVIPTITRWGLDKIEKMYNISSTTDAFTDKVLSSKEENNRPTELTKYSYAPILKPDAKPIPITNSEYADLVKNVKDFYALTYSPEHVRAIRNIYEVQERMYGNTPTDLFNGKSDSEVTLEEYLNGLETAGVLYPTDYVSASVETALPAGKAHPEWRTLHTHLVKSIFREENENNKLVDMIDNAATILDTNSPGLVTENTETFTYHDVITPLRAYRLNAGENVVRHIYKEVPKGSVIATYRDEAGNDLIDAKQVKTNESEGTAYNTQSETIAPRVTTETTPEGFTKTITKTYELIAEPQNKDGEVIGNQTITVPYVYRVTTDTVINGSVIATYKDTEGNVLAPQEAIKTNVAPNEAYTTNAKEIPAKTITEVLEDGSTKTTTITYELVENPTNKDGEVQGGKTITVPYVYNKKVTEVITPKPQPEKPKEDKPKEDKPKEETPKETPKPKEEPKETPKVEQPKPKESPKMEQPKETPKPKDEPKETPKEDEKPKGDTPKVEQPKEAPKENPKTEKPNVPIKEELPKTKEIPQTDKPKEDNSKEIPKKDSNPVNEPVKSQVQKTELPNTGAKQDSTGVLGLISLLLSGGLLTLKRRKNAE